jgi:hypothetical protein
MRIKSLSGFIAFSTLVACGGGSGSGYSSPEKAVNALVKGLTSGDSSFCTQISPSVEALMAVLDCPAESQAALTQGVGELVQECVGEVERAVGQLEGIKVKVASVSTTTDEVTASAGDDFEFDCKATAEIREIEAAVTLTMTKDGEGEDRTESMGFIGIANRFYLIEM